MSKKCSVCKRPKKWGHTCRVASTEVKITKTRRGKGGIHRRKTSQGTATWAGS